eukprot:1201828-Amphidinium_carterae.1
MQVDFHGLSKTAVVFQQGELGGLLSPLRTTQCARAEARLCGVRGLSDDQPRPAGELKEGLALFQLCREWGCIWG